MGYHADIYAALNLDTALNALVGNRIFPDVADASAQAPFVVYQTISTGGENVHDGERSYQFPLVQFSCWAKTRAAALAVARAVTNVLDGKKLPGNSDCSCQFANQSSAYELDTRLFGETIEFTCATLNQ